MLYIYILLGMVVYFLPIILLWQKLYQSWEDEAAGELDPDEPSPPAWIEQALKVAIVVWILLPPVVLMYFSSK